MDQVERKLAAIVSADVVGWSRLMGADEAGTHAALKSHREEMIDHEVERSSGRVVSTAGDSLLIEFASAVCAVECAIAVQRQMVARTSSEPEDERIVFRIGINLGEVIVDGDDIFGDGVNIAARLQALAAPGEVYVSSDVHRQVNGRLDVEFEDMGEQAAKNIAEPIHVFRVMPEGLKQKTTLIADKAEATPVADKPRIAVLPFDNMSGDAEQEFFTDGMTEDIITELSRNHGLFVIARNTTFTYKGKPADVTQISRDLKVRYVVEGSVRRAGDRVRINVQLLDGASGHHLWAERFDRTLDDVFAVQDEITQRIVAALPRHVEAAQLAASRARPTENMVAYEYLLRAKDHHHRRSKEDNALAQTMVVKAIELDPDYAEAYAWRACILSQAWGQGYADDQRQVIKDVARAAKKVQTLDQDDAECHRILCELKRLFENDLPQARVHQDRAFLLNPNDPRIVSQRGELMTLQGELDEAVKWISLAMELDPTEAPRRAAHLALAHFVGHNYEAALDAMLQVPAPGFTQELYFAAILAMLGRDDEAAVHRDKALAVNPGISVSWAISHTPFARAEDVAHLRTALEKTGLPA